MVLALQPDVLWTLPFVLFVCLFKRGGCRAKLSDWLVWREEGWLVCGGTWSSLQVDVVLWSVPPFACCQ